MLIKKNTPLLISCGLGILIFFISKNYGMFWDNVLFGSKMGNELYNHGIFNWTMPDSFDPGHPPFLGFLLAVFWKVFGQNLWVSHLAMLPFVIGLLFQLQQLTLHFTNNKKLSYLAFFFIIIDPSLSSSLMLVNPETIILFFSVLCINQILNKSNKWKFISLFFLSIISFRSMMIFAGLSVFDILNQRYFQKRTYKDIIKIRFLLFYFLASLPGTIFVTWRLATKGWLQTHTDSPWSSLWKFPSLEEFIRNVGVLIWRYLDFGRVFMFSFLLIALLYYWRKKQIDTKIKQLLLLAFACVIFVIIACLFSTNSFGHRYFILSFLCLTMVSFLLISKLSSGKKIVLISLVIGLLSGNLWVYPKDISQGWDATLGHTPYHSLRIEALGFLDSEQIEFTTVGTFFPNYNSLDEIDFNNDLRKLAHFDNNNSFVFYSNVFNLNSQELSDIENNYLEIKRFTSPTVYISILKKKED